MKDIPFKNGFIYKSMKKHRIKLLVYTLVTALILVLYFLAFKPYITNILFGSVPLDTAMFSNDAKTITLAKDDKLGRHEAITIKSYSLKSTSYWQGDNYEFDTVLSDVKKMPLNYTTRNTSDSFVEGESEEHISAQVYTAKIGDTDVVILAYPHHDLKDGSIASGIFTEMPRVMQVDLSSLDDVPENVYQYIFDMRGIEMGNERFDLIVCIILLLILMYLAIKLAVYFINPYLTPTYRGIEKYGDTNTIISDVESQLQKAGTTKIKRKKSVYTQDWIVSEDSFKLKIAKNHAKPQDNSRYGSKL